MKLMVQQQEEILVVKLPVDHLDTANSSEFKQAINDQVDAGKQIILDLSNIRFVDSSGLGAFLSSLRRINNNGGHLMMCNLTTAVKALFELVRMNKVFDIYESLEIAVNAIRK